MSDESPEVADLFERISRCLPYAQRLSATIFRSAGIKYANEADFASGAGAEFYGARWNPKSVGIRAVYGSLKPVVAAIESYQQFKKFGFAPNKIRPRVFAGIEIKAAKLLDLTDPKIRRKIGFTLAELMEEDWEAIQDGGEESWTQTIGRGCFLTGFEGLIVNSAQIRREKNVIIFPENLRSTSYIRLIASDDLPPHPPK